MADPNALKEVLQGLSVKDQEKSAVQSHAFWDTQPVPSLGEDSETLNFGPIDPPDVSAVRSEPYKLPAAFRWAEIDMEIEEDVKELYTLLHENYVEDGDNMFRFDYSEPFLHWALCPPGFLREWHVGVRVVATNKLVAFICCTPAELYSQGQRVEASFQPQGAPPPSGAQSQTDAVIESVEQMFSGELGRARAPEAAAAEVESGSAAASSSSAAAASSSSDADGLQLQQARALLLDKSEVGGDDDGEDSPESGSVVEVNFLCVHKKLRSKRLAPVLIKEITRRVNVRGMFQAAYTAGVVLPKPISRCRYWHRSLNPKKLIEVGFSRLAPRMTITRTIKLYALPEVPLTKGLRKLEEADCEQCCSLLNKFLQRFKVAPRFTIAEFKHWMLTQPGVVYSYVVEDENKKITDMFSFYSLPSSVLGNEKHQTLYAAYSYYFFNYATPLTKLMNDALILAKRHDFDVFNALDILDNENFFKELKFGIGDGHLQYYLFNWRCASIKPNEVGLVLL